MEVKPGYKLIVIALISTASKQRRTSFLPSLHLPAIFRILKRMSISTWMKIGIIADLG
jgi:hypothetical protein